MRSRSRLLAVLAVVACAVPLAVRAAGAADAPGAPPVPRALPAIDHPFLLGLVGTWDVIGVGEGADRRARASLALGVGDTTLLHDYVGDGAPPFVGHGLYRVLPDGRTVVCWWFDSYAREPVKMVGPLTPVGAELSGSAADGPVTIRWSKGADGVDFEMTSGGRTVLEQRYRRPAK